MPDRTANTPPDSLADEPFSFREVKGGGVQISCRGRIVKHLRGRDAVRFLARAAGTRGHDQQLLMARATGQFKFGNERDAKQHSRRG